MKALVYFDSSASSSEIQGELYQLRSAPGVKSVEFLRRVAGEAPMYCLNVDVEDSAATGLSQRLEAAKSQYAGYVSNLRLVTYQPA